MPEVEEGHVGVVGGGGAIYSFAETLVVCHGVMREARVWGC